MRRYDRAWRDQPLNLETRWRWTARFGLAALIVVGVLAALRVT